jgi:hypothetical protein
MCVGDLAEVAIGKARVDPVDLGVVEGVEDSTRSSRCGFSLPH